MDDLEVIANLEHGKAVERISSEMQHKMQNALAGKASGGAREYAKLRVQLDAAAETCKAYAQIWQDLLEGKNGGYLIRENVDFIAQKVIAMAASRKSNFGKDFPRETAGVESEVGMRLDSIVASIRRDLEIRIRRQQAFPEKKETMSYKREINVTIHNAANVNLGTQVGTINATLDIISEHAGSSQGIVQAIKELTDAVVQSAEVDDAKKQELLEVVEDIAKQAEAKPEERSPGRLKAMFAGLPTLLSVGKGLLDVWDRLSPAI